MRYFAYLIQWLHVEFIAKLKSKGRVSLNPQSISDRASSVIRFRSLYYKTRVLSNFYMESGDLGLSGINQLCQ